MINKLIFPLLLLMFLAQWLVPGKLIYDSEKTNAEGESYKFKIRPVDPYDPFRGKYITLTFEDCNLVRDTLEKFDRDQSVFVLVGPDTAGFAQIKAISKSTFGEHGYFEATVLWYSKSDGDSVQTVQLDFPFKKFFLEESLAPDAEAAYNQSRNDTIPAYALVNILDGKAILRDVVLNDSSIAEVVKARQRKY